jgi:hypothetical protein
LLPSQREVWVFLVDSRNQISATPKGSSGSAMERPKNQEFI